MSDKDRDNSMDSLDIINSLKNLENHIKTIRRNMRIKKAEKYKAESLSTVSTVSTASTEIDSWEPPDINQNLSTMKSPDDKVEGITKEVDHLCLDSSDRKRKKVNLLKISFCLCFI